MRLNPPPDLGRKVTPDDLQAEALFADLSDTALQTLLEHSRLCRLDPRQTLHLTRQQAEFFYVIKSGFVTAKIKSLVEKTNHFYAWRGPGQILGEVSILHGRPHVSVIRATDECALLELPAAAFVQVADTEPFLYRNLARLVAGKHYDSWLRSEIMQIPLASSLRRVASLLFLLTEARGYDPGTKILSGHIPKIDIAGYIGAGENSVSDSLTFLRDEKIISYGGTPTGKYDGRIEILDRERLDRQR